MFTKQARMKYGFAGAAGLMLMALALSACTTLTTAIDTMNKQLATAGSGAVVTPKLDFYLFYAMASVFDVSASQGAAYAPGQGTVWTVTDTNNGTTETSTFEQALLKRNGNGTAWWRLDVTSKDGSILYEYLLGPDRTIEKVRYKDPNTGKIEEFVPDKSNEQQARQQQPETAAQAPSSSGTAANGDKVTVKKDRQTVTVKAGTFTTDHVVYTDETKQVRDESWTSNKVPGALVKFVDTDMKTNSVMSSGELTKIQTGMTTVLNSY